MARDMVKQIQAQLQEWLDTYPECRVTHIKSDMQSEVARLIDKIVHKKRLYLDPAMNLSRMAGILGTNRTYVSKILAQWHGYRNYINECRLIHLDRQLRSYFQKQDDEAAAQGLLMEPDYTIEPRKLSVMILGSGFADRRTFRRALESSRSAVADSIRDALYKKNLFTLPNA